MLVLTRHIGEAITIGDDIKITVSAINNQEVKLAIHAPNGLMIEQEDTFQITQKQKKKHKHHTKNKLYR